MLIAQGSSELSISFAVPGGDLKAALNRVHDALDMSRP